MTRPAPEAFLAALPFAAALGMRVESLGQGRARIGMDWDARFVGDPETGVIHGGAVSALMDTCCGAAVLACDGAVGTATIDLRIDYMRSARPGARIVAEAQCYHTTRTVAFVRATATDGAGDTPVASATGAFVIDRTPEAAPE